MELKDIKLKEHIGTTIHINAATFIFSSDINNIYIITRRNITTQFIYDLQANKVYYIVGNQPKVEYKEFLKQNTITYNYDYALVGSMDQQILDIIPIITEYNREMNFKLILNK